MSATPEQIAAAWATWKVRHKGSIGPGPGFVEAINAAIAQQPLSVPTETLYRWRGPKGGWIYDETKPTWHAEKLEIRAAKDAKERKE